jgi:hypothetical protein
VVAQNAKDPDNKADTQDREGEGEGNLFAIKMNYQVYNATDDNFK